MIPQLLKTKLTAGVIAVTFCSAGVAAAATGGLPGPLQRGLDRAAAVVGHDAPPNHGSTDVDESDETSSTTSGDTTTTEASSTTSEAATTSSSSTSSTTQATTATSDATTSSTDDRDDEDADHEDADHDADHEAKDTPIGPDATGPAKKGLCTAYMASVANGHSKNADAVAFRNLADAAEAAGQSVEEFCTTDGTPVDTGTSTTAGSMTSSTSMPGHDDDDDEMAAPSAKAHGKSGNNGNNGKKGKP